MCKKKQFKYCPSEIDKCMRKMIENLNILFPKNIKTIASCCGHGIYPMTIVVKNTMWKEGECNFELFSGKYIPRKRNLYKKDKKGYYYIPEVSEEKK